MADTKITALSALTAADPANDVLPIVDVNDPFMAASGTTKKISINNILGASGTATLASATITGDLTVDTSTLKVDSANNRVGIGTASPALPLEIYKASGDSKMRITSGANSLTIGWDDPNGFYCTANTSLMAWQLSGSTAMTLNATGLGVGVASPSYNIHARGTTNGRIQVEGASGFGMVFIQGSSGNTAQLQLNSSGGTGRRFNLYSDPTGLLGISDETAVATRLTIDASGNVGIGVTLSAWGAGYKALQLGNGLSLMGSTINATLAANAWFDGTNWKYISANPATLYYGSYAGNGSHVWSISSGVPSAGGNVSLTNAMTLDASGNLLVGTTSGTFRGTFVVAGGANRDILAAGVTAVSDGFQVKWNHATTKINVIISNMPTSSAGLAAGTLWNDAGTIKIA